VRPPQNYKDVDIKKYNCIKCFKTVVTSTVALTAALLFVTATPSQAQIISEVDNDTIINNDTIFTTDDDGIYSEGRNSTITNNGSITTVGVGDFGITSLGDGATITNNGTISTTGQFSHGIELAGDGSTLNNFGTIRVTGWGSRGLNMPGSSTVNNSGLISATSDATHAIMGGSGDSVLNLLSGSQIIGKINLLSGTDTVNISGRNNSSTLTIEGAESINLSGPGVVVGNVVIAVDPTGQSVKAPVLNSLCTGLHGVIRNRLNHFKPELIKLASTRIEPGMLKTPDQPQVWGSPFHSYRRRDDHGLLFAYDHEYNGFSGGFERTFRRLRAGVMGGFSRANVEADSESFRTDSNSYFTGIYGQYDFGRIKLSASLIGGYEDHDNTRMVVDNLSGFENARADFGSLFLSPSVTVRADYTVAHKLLLRPMASVVYSAGWYDDYHEHGTTRSNLEIDDRTLQALNSTLQLSAIYQIAEWCQFELSAGGNARYTDDGSIDGNVGGSDFRFTATNDDSIYSGQLGAYLGVNVSDQLNLYINAEFSEASGDETRNFFMAGLKFNF